jgi:hypothetical protein
LGDLEKGDEFFANIGEGGIGDLVIDRLEFGG